MIINPFRLIFLVFLSIIFIASCDNHKSSSFSPDTNSEIAPPEPTPDNIEDIIQRLESNGTLPQLDRSSDIVGPDTDNNGIRDDIDKWISLQNVDSKQEKALIQSALVFQKTLVVDINSQTELREVSRDISNAVNCIVDSFPDEESRDGHYYSGYLERITMNTKERFLRYDEFNQACSGMVITLPEGDSCND